MSTLLKFELGVNVLQFEEGASYPASRPVEKLQIVDRTAGGTLQVEELGITIRTRVLSFVDMLKSDYDALENWFDNVSNGALNSFDFTDEYGNTGSVKILENKLDFIEGDFELFNGSITLEYQ